MWTIFGAHETGSSACEGVKPNHVHDVTGCRLGVPVIGLLSSFTVLSKEQINHGTQRRSPSYLLPLPRSVHGWLTGTPDRLAIKSLLWFLTRNWCLAQYLTRRVAFGVCSVRPRRLRKNLQGACAGIRRSQRSLNTAKNLASVSIHHR